MIGRPSRSDRERVRNRPEHGHGRAARV